MDDESLQSVYCWVDEIPLTRPKRNISRDFSDGVLMAEIVNHYFPRIVELHNYSQANSVRQKLYNWNTLNTKVFKKIGYQISQKDVNNIVKCQPGSIEKCLFDTKTKLEMVKASGGPPREERPSRNQGQGRRKGEGRHPAPRAADNVRAPRGEQRESKYDNGGGRPAQDQSRFSGPWQSSVDSMHSRPVHQGVDEDILLEKEETIQELRETVEILELKVKKLEQLVRLKDSKIAALQSNRD
jgi:hypothetical protein